MWLRAAHVASGDGDVRREIEAKSALGEWIHEACCSREMLRKFPYAPTAILVSFHAALGSLTNARKMDTDGVWPTV